MNPLNSILEKDFPHWDEFLKWKERYHPFQPLFDESEESLLSFDSFGPIKSSRERDLYKQFLKEKEDRFKTEHPYIENLENRINVLEQKKRQIYSKTGLMTDDEKQVISIGGNIFPNFETLFQKRNIKGKSKKGKRKGGIATIYGISKLSNGDLDRNQEFENKDVLVYYKLFKSERKNWEFLPCGNKKGPITKTDCESVNSIFKSCGMGFRIFLSEDKIKVK